jgi:hypothetical protein
MMVKRKLIVISLSLFFFILLGGLTACSLAETASEVDLANAIGTGDENGPGSGNWQPPTPENRNQCRRLHGVGEQLAQNMTPLLSDMTRIQDRCVDGEGAFLPGVNKARCTEEYEALFDQYTPIITDWETGKGVYEQTCYGDVDLGDSIDLDDGGSFAEPWPLEGKCCRCLTCTQQLNFGYAYYQPVTLGDPSG